MEATRGSMPTPASVKHGGSPMLNQENNMRYDPNVPPLPSHNYQQVAPETSIDVYLEKARELRTSQSRPSAPTHDPRTTVAGTPTAIRRDTHPSAPLPRVSSETYHDQSQEFRSPNYKNPQNCTIEELISIVRSIDAEYHDTKNSHLANRDAEIASINEQIALCEEEKAEKEEKRDTWQSDRSHEYDTLMAELTERDINTTKMFDEFKEQALEEARTPSGNPIKDRSFIPSKTAEVEKNYRDLLREFEEELALARSLAEKDYTQDLETKLPLLNRPIKQLERRIQQLKSNRESIIQATDQYISAAKQEAEARRLPYVQQYQQLTAPAQKGRGKRRSNQQRTQSSVRSRTTAPQRGRSAPPNGSSQVSEQVKKSNSSKMLLRWMKENKRTTAIMGSLIAGSAVWLAMSPAESGEGYTDNSAQVEAVELQEDTRTALDQTEQYIEAALTNPAVAVKDPDGLELNLFNGQNYIEMPGDDGQKHEFTEDDGQQYDFVLKAVMAGVLEQKVQPSDGYTADIIPLDTEFAKQAAPELGINDFNPAGYNSPQNVTLIAAKALNQTALELGTEEGAEARSAEYLQNPRKYYEDIIRKTYGIEDQAALKQIVDLCEQMQQEAEKDNANQEPAE